MGLLDSSLGLVGHWFERWMENRRKKKYSLIFGEPTHPELLNYDHKSSVVVFAVQNIHAEPAVIKRVFAFDARNRPLAITWGNGCTELGMPENPNQPIRVAGTATIAIRRNDGEVLEATMLRIIHTFCTSPTEVFFDPYAGFGED